ncbi:response regulator [Prochlorothrix hollandica]|uniref:Chemotaxis protein CheY n=1 Tax=Prochlorothrix hollandica PCC 9006 = CALU 1027 TaxID=317619 RepID=A0A0M2PRD2_PROHO|nr:response regulator [Prochlorothrix hollandica]KKI99095.1 chemotaxis protein CheY [Prochlorothrix hollandica PCC 9006 = CALU 1027]
MKSVLVVDDSRTELKLMEAILHQIGFRVATVDNAEAALSFLETEIPDLLVLDVVMPDMSGFDLCRQLRAKPTTEKLPIIFCSSKDQEFDRFWALRQGGNAYLTKPFAPHELIETVNTCLP